MHDHAPRGPGQGQGQAQAHNQDRRQVERMGFSVWFTLVVFVAEVAGGVLTNSLALLSDAWHVLVPDRPLGGPAGE